MPRGIPRNRAEQPEVTPAITQEATASPQPEALSARAEQTRRERRRRNDGDLDLMGRMALSIPPEVQDRLKREGKTARWVRDASGRQTAMHREDWDVTPDVEAVAEARDSEGKLVLMEKYQDWYDDDQRRKTAMLDEREKAIESAQGENRQSGDNLVIPTGVRNRISLERGL